MARIDTNVTRHPDFVDRLNKACDAYADCPTGNGRQAWLKRKLLQEQKVIVSAETLSKWFSGEAKPRESTCHKIASILGVDAALLYLGRTFLVNDPRSADVSSAHRTGTVDLPIFLRDETLVEIRNLPRDLTSSEAKRIANIIIAYAIEE